jgi:general secretion pathway protein I
VTTRELGPPTEPALERLCRGRGRRLSAKRAVGFTLIEILVAVAILAVALAATTRAASMATDGAFETRHRLLATWAAQNRVAEIRARGLFPPATTTRLGTEQGGMALALEETVTDTPNPNIRRIDVAVADARDPARVLTRLTAYVSR